MDGLRNRSWTLIMTGYVTWRGLRQSVFNEASLAAVHRSVTPQMPAANIWQSLVMIGPETPEIRRRKKITRIETSAVKYNGRRPASWRAAIISK